MTRTHALGHLLYAVVIVALLAAGMVAGLVPVRLETFLIVLMCFAFELMDSSLGMGYGTTLTPVLLLFGFKPLELVPVILVSELLTGFSASFFHSSAGNVVLKRGSRHLHAAVILSVFSFVGVIAGVHLALTVSRTVLTIIIGAIITISGIAIFVASGRTFRYSPWRISILGAVASFNKSISGGGYGPLMTSGQVLSGVEAKAAVGITSFAEAFTCLGGVILYLIRGQAFDVELLIPVCAGAMLSVPFSAQIVKRVDETWMKRFVGAFSIVMGGVILWKVLG